MSFSKVHISLLSVCGLFLLWACSLTGSDEKDKRYIEVDNSNIDINNFDKIEFQGVNKNSSDTISIYLWEPGAELPVKVYLPASIKEEFTLIIIGRKGGEITLFNTASIDTKYPNDALNMQDITTLINPPVPVIDTIYDWDMIEGGLFMLNYSFQSWGSVLYTWYKDGQVVSHDSILSIDYVDESHSGSYKLLLVNARNPADSVSSNIFNLSVVKTTPPIRITRYLPSALNVVAGDTLTLGIQAEGFNLFYDWYKNGVIFSEGRRNSLTFAPVTISDSGRYMVKVYNIYNPDGIISNTSFLSVDSAYMPLVLVQDLDSVLTLVQGSPLSLTVAVTGSYPVFSWYKDNVFISTGTSGTLDLSKIQKSDEGRYYVLISNDISISPLKSDTLSLKVLESAFFITLKSTPGGSITPDSSGSIVIPTGSSQKFDFHPEAGWEIASVKIDYELDSNAIVTGTHEFRNVNSSHTIDVTFSPVQYTFTAVANDTAYGSVTFNPVKTRYLYRDTVIIIAVPKIGHTFAGWSPSGDKHDTLTVVITGDSTFTAQFNPKDTYGVIVYTNEPNHVSKEPLKSSYSFGDQVTITAQPDSGYIFNRWVFRDTVLYIPAISIQIDSNYFITAEFIRAQLSMSLRAEPAMVNAISRDTLYAYGQPKEVWVIPMEAFSFDYWYEESGRQITFIDSTQPTTQFISQADSVRIVARLSRKKHSVSYSVTPQGAGSPSGLNTAEWEVPFTLKANPSEGYELVKWHKIEGSGTLIIDDSTADSTQAAVRAGPVIIQAVYQLKSYNLSLTASISGVNIKGPVSCIHDSAYTIIAGTHSANTFSHWSIISGSATISDTASDTATIRLTAGEAAVQANYSPKPVLPDVEFSPVYGRFNNSVSVTLQANGAPPGVLIYYTSDGTEPIISSSLYTAAIPLTDTATIRARAFLPERYLPSRSITQNVYIKNSAPSIQPPAGFSFLRDSVVIKTVSDLGGTIIEDDSIVSLSATLNGASHPLIYSNSSWAFTNPSLNTAQWNNFQIMAEDSDGLKDTLVFSIYLLPNLSAPVTSLKESLASSIIFQWSMVQYAAYYKIFRSSDGVTYALLDSITGRTYKDSGFTQRQFYYYTVQAFISPSGGIGVFDSSSRSTPSMFASAFVGQYYYDSDARSFSSIRLADGSLVLGGGKSNGATLIDAALWKVDTVGNSLWLPSRYFDNGGTENKLETIISTTDNGFLGVSEANGAYCLFKFTSAGDTSWTMLNTADGTFEPKSLLETSDNYYYTAGNFTSNSTGYQQAFFYKQTLSGSVSLTKYIGTTATESFNKVVESNSNLFFMGTADNGTYGQDFFVYVTTLAGDSVASFKYGDNRDQAIYGAVIGHDQQIFAVGHSGSQNSQYTFTKIHRTFYRMLYSKHYPTNAYTGLHDITPTSDGGYAACGFTNLSGNSQCFLVKFDSEGDTTWTQNYGGAGKEECFSVHEDALGGFAVTGYSETNGTRAYIVYTDKYGDTRF